MKQIMIVGAGSVGGFFGAHLAQHHADVSFLLRPRTLQAVQKHGLTIRSAGGNLTVHPKAAADPRDLPTPDLIIVAVKAYDLDTVLNQIDPILSDTAVILTLQNGVDVEERILARVQRDCVVGGVAYIYSKIVAPGVIEHYKRGAVAIGELSGEKTDRVHAIADVFARAELPCQVVDDIRRTKWEKMCWNCAFNPLTVLIDDRVAKALDHPEMLGTIRRLVEEVAAVAAALHVPLPADMPDRVLRWTQEIRDIHTSMYDDWKAGRPTEIDSLNGYVARRARESGIPAPINEALTGLVKVITERDKAGPDVVRVEGEVIRPIAFSREALRQLPEEHQVADVSAVQPGMTGRGIRLEGLLAIPAINIGVDHVTIHANDGRFAVTLTLEQAKAYGILIYELDHAPLPADRGGPFRLITPGLGDACANVKGVGRIELRRGAGKDTRPA